MEYKVDQEGCQNRLHLLLGLLHLSLLIVVTAANCISSLLCHELLILLSERIVFEGDFITQITTDIHLRTQQKWRHSLLLHLALAIFVNVDEGVGCLGRSCMTTKGFTKHDIFDLHTHIYIAEAPPCLLLAIKYKTVVMTALSSAIVDQNRM